MLSPAEGKEEIKDVILTRAEEKAPFCTRGKTNP